MADRPQHQESKQRNRCDEARACRRLEFELMRNKARATISVNPTQFPAPHIKPRHFLFAADHYTVRVDSKAEQRRYLTAKLCRMQHELARLVEHFYQQQVEHDDDLQLLTSRAYDDVRELTGICSRCGDLP